MAERGVSVIEAARRLGISSRGIYEAIASGRLQATKRRVVRRVLRIDAASLAGFAVSTSHQKRGRAAAALRYPPEREAIVI